MTLTDFLHARIDDDEAAVRGWPDDVEGFAPDGRPWRDTSGRFMWAPRARVLAECDAKRAIVEEHYLGREAYPGCTVEEDPTCMCCSAGGEFPSGWPCKTLSALLAVYRHHPDFDPEWLL